jgi:MFS family permease
MPAAPTSGVRGRGWFNAVVASWFASFGMQSVLFSWLIVGELRASAEWVGFAQSASVLPQLVLLVVGGAVADRVEPRRLLTGMHVVAALPPILLAVVILFGQLSIASVIVYGVAIGVINAFLMPARDSLLSRVAGTMMIQTVTLMTVVQFSAQIIGTLVAGVIEWVGTPTILGLQSVVLFGGVWFASHLPGVPAKSVELGAQRSSGNAWHQIMAGVREVAGDPALRAMGILVACVGLFFIGPFLVVFPILVRDVYEGGAQALAIVLMLFPLGTIIGSFALRQRGFIRRKIRATMFALMIASILLGWIGLQWSWGWFLALTLCWGLTGSVFINLSRAVFQEKASEANRARVLSIYQLGLIAGAPIGSLLAGLMSGAFGPDVAISLAAGTMFTVVALLWLLTDTASIE